MEPRGPWQPANEVERALRDTLARGDADGYRQVLGSATLVLPIPPGSGRGGPAPWPTGEHAGRTYILAFTSPEAMRGAVGAQASVYRTAVFADVAHTWPDPEAWLAVDLGLPVQALLDAEAVSRTAWRAERSSYPVDAALRAAVRLGDEAAYALALLGADLAMPVSKRSETASGEPVIVAYSSIQRLRADLGDVEHTVDDFGTVAREWPDPAYSLAVNPGTPVAGLISGAAMGGLAEWIDRAEREAEQAAAAIGDDVTLGEMERELAAHEAARAAVARLLRG